MKAFLLAILLIIFPASARDLVIRDITVLPMDQPDALTRQTVIIRDGIIIAMGSDLEIPEDARVIEGKGRFLLPGYADMHAHLPGQVQANFGNEEYLRFQVAAGVTTVRSMRWDESHRQLRQNIIDGKLQGPDLYLAGPMVHRKADLSTETVASFVTQVKKDGYHHIKVLSVADAPLFDKLMEAAAAEEIRVVGHVPSNVGLEKAIALGLSSVEHLQGYQEGEVTSRLIQQTVAADVYNCPTLDWYFIGMGYYNLEQLRSRRGLAWMPQEMVTAWENKIATQAQQDADEKAKAMAWLKNKTNLLRRLYDAGAPLLLSPDVGGAFGIPGFNMFEEMKLYTQAGIPNQAVLEAATYNAAKYWGETHLWGSVRPGRRANLVMLSADPRMDIQNAAAIEGVILRGSWLSKQWLTDDLKSVRSSGS